LQQRPSYAGEAHEQDGPPATVVDVDPDIQEAYDTLFEEARSEIVLEWHNGGGTSAEPHDYPAVHAHNTALVSSPQKSIRERGGEEDEEEQEDDDWPLRTAYGLLEDFRGQREALATEHLLLMDSPPRLRRRHHLRPQSSSRSSSRRATAEVHPREQERAYVTDTDVENLAENIRSWRIPSPKKRAKRNSQPAGSSSNKNRPMPFGAKTGRTHRSSSSSASSSLVIRQQKHEPSGIGWLARAVQPSKIRGGILDLSVR
jgi:hypothetical protein